MDTLSLSAPYWAAHGALMGSYLLLRSFFPGSALQHPSSFFPSVLTREMELVLVTMTLTMFRAKRAPTLLAAAHNAVFYVEAMVGVLYYFMDFRIAGAYAVVVLAVSTLLQRPEAPLRASNVEELTPVELNVIVKPSTSTSAQKWLVFFGRGANDTLLPAFEAVAYRLRPAKADGKSPYRFGYVDVSRWPSAATLAGIDTTFMSGHVPCIIAWDRDYASKPQAERVLISARKRFPPLLETGEVYHYNVKVDAEQISKYFSLE